MSEVLDTKRILKQWETRFFKENGRKPNKVDIDAAPDDIKQTYSKYTKLRKGQSTPVPHSKGDNSENSKPTTEVGNDKDCPENVENDSSMAGDVWGSQFDRKTVTEQNNVPVKEKTDSKPSFLKSLGQKMYQQSLKLNKLQTTVPLGKPTWKKPDTPRPVRNMSIFSPTSVPAKDDKESKIELGPDSLESQTTDDQPVLFGKVFQKAIMIAKHKVQIQNNTDGESDAFMTKYAMKSKPKQSFLPSSYSGLLEKHRQNLVIEEDVGDESFDKPGGEDANNDEDNMETDGGGGHSWHMSVSKLIREDELEVKRNKRKQLKEENDQRKALEKSLKESKKGKTLLSGAENEESNVSDKISKPKSTTVRKKTESIMEDEKSVSSVKTKSKVELDRIAENEVNDKDTFDDKHTDEFNFDNNSSDADSPVKPKPRKRVSKTAGTKAKRKVKALASSDEDGVNVKAADKDSDGSDVESGTKKRKKAIKAQPAAKKRKTLADNVSVDDEGGIVKSVPAPRAPSRGKAPATDGNFIRLNMKIKTYKRKGRHMTGPQHKRMQWKQKMQARSKSYGDACFKCGQPGHWANKCPNKAGQANNNYEKEPVNDEDFPSMQEAAMLAKGLRQKKSETLPTSQKSQAVGPAQTVSTSVDQENEDTTEEAGNTVEDIDEDLDIQSGIVRSRTEVTVAMPAMEPLIECDGDNIPATPSFVMKGLKKFGFEKFRPGQEEAVMRILCGLSTLVVLSTGGGKSLCYQLPAYLYSQRSTCITLVVSPLVSLMEDQVTGLAKGICGVCLHTNMTASQRESVLNMVKSGKAQFLLVSPEAIAGGSMSLIASMSSLPPIAFVCIDEAHCLSEWSHNFRPSYLRLCKVLQEKLGVNCFLGLTATATASTASDVARHLKISDFKKATVRGSPIPANLILSVSRDESREEALIGLLKGERFGKLESIIIYCTRRDQTTKVATIIRTCMNTSGPVEKMEGKSRRSKPKLEWDAESYHAGLSPAQRKRVQNAFMSGKLRVVVATVAFGMGLDKSDVRGVIHYNMPKSFESYVQEIGRAGRDGQRADCHVFLDAEGKDLCELRRHTYANTVDYRTLKKLVQRVFPPCRCKDVHERHLQAARDIDFDEEFEMDMDESCDSKPNSDNYNVNTGSPLNEKLDDCVSTPEKKRPKEQALTQASNEQSDSYESGDKLSNSSGVVGNNNINEPGDNDGTTEQEMERSSNIPSSNVPHATNMLSPRLSNKKRLCPGHERALPIQQTVMDLDVKEEGISTLLCYLELHANEWLENLSNVYANCRIQCYGGPAQLQAVAKKCPPVAVAIAKARKEGQSFTNSNSIEFPVVDISDTMGWDSGPVKKELKLLQWNFDSGAPRRTGLMVEFSDLAFHIRTPGDFTVEELDEILQFLHERIQRQEKSEIQNLSRLCKALRSVSHKNYYMCSEEADLQKNEKLKGILNEYFDKQDETDSLESFDDNFEDEPVPEFSEAQIIGDIRAFYNLYGQEHTLTGRAIARIFHGIASPCFPALSWGRVRRFWRSHLDVDFNTIMKLATKELVWFR